MIDIKILQFLALASFMVVFTDAHYPYSQQQYYNNNQHYANQNYYPNDNLNSYNHINKNNNIIYSNINSNNNIDDDNNKNNNEYIKSNRRNGPNSNPLLAINLPKIYLGDFEYVPTPNGYRFSYDRIDGSRHTEVGVIPDSENTGSYVQDKQTAAERTALRMRGRENSRNRKLSPKSLQSLAG